MRRHKQISCTVTNDLTHDRRMHRICDTLAGMGYDVCLIGRELPGSDPLPARKFRQHRIRPWFRRGFLFYAEWNIRLWWYHLRRRADILWAVDLDTLPAACLLPLRRPAVVYDAHEWFPEVPELQGRPFVRAVWSRIGRWFVPCCQLRITVNALLAEELKATYGCPFESIRNLPERYPIGPEKERKADPPVILYQGALNEGRCLEALLDAMADLDGFQCWIVGEGDLSNSLRKRAESLQLGDRVRFTGYLAPEDLPAVTARAWLGYNLLDASSRSYRYSLANKFFDYIQADIPSLNSDLPAYREIVEKWEVGLLLPSFRSDEIVRAVQRIWKDTPSYQRMVDACSEAAGYLNWESEADLLRSLMKDLEDL